MDEHITTLLGKMPVFQGLSTQQLQALANIAEPIRYQPGDLIFSEGDPAAGFFLVLSGQVKVFKMSFDGKEQVLHFVGPDEIFAEVPVYSGGAYPANAAALRETKTFFFPRAAIRRLLAKDPNLAMNMLADLSKRLRQLTRLVENLSLKESPARLAAYLLHAGSELVRADEVELDVTKGQLATLLGTTPETLSRTLKKMSENGVIEVHGRTIRLLDKAALEDMAAG
ncbi:transcriptional regulator, Crp/Fnr family [Desulfonatronum thiosulfatophilum]|uniref:Transcriptional regulator, Crp/Fnr family n=1 Tax=Desulfonatronum thiosulfatophilum TaxID=617002 RepID=A0A1G6A0B6_9BACT|nr:Crp/Fnr family transcriptional regulator [Desulfonatronum thiosulfatophilum]SDB01908.1 transcriptional regulator, Crp/Fnr family [Desulfonatronum thiosulfatophilum]